MFSKLLFFIKHASFSTLLVILVSAIAIIGGTVVTAIVVAEHYKQPAAIPIVNDDETSTQPDEEPTEPAKEDKLAE